MTSTEQPIVTIDLGNQEDGANSNERLLFSAKQDLEDLFLEIIDSNNSDYDINFKDGLGNTALHYAVMNLSPNVLELILEHEGCDVDLLNYQGQTPLHCAMNIKDLKPRLLITKSLLEAGADPRIRNKYHEKPIDTLLSPQPSDEPELVELRKCLMEAEAEINIAPDDIANDYEDDLNDVASEDSG
ncbi:hypothetical protein O181_030174 [Austropuccinia psidii MF-1]|uniref:Ankyrin repeat-containing protein n=1 Tax=Austropuccinia psidii MF-1 TaxID=1389203 RepID=A0A9Q3CTK4_9BASI|nr:hypothetical protein [Austropuccinia psidii MF-1]